jgi:hypothetical protein
MRFNIRCGLRGVEGRGMESEDFRISGRRKEIQDTGRKKMG